MCLGTLFRTVRCNCLLGGWHAATARYCNPAAVAIRSSELLGRAMALDRGSTWDFDAFQARRGAGDNGNRGLRAAEVLCNQANKLSISLTVDWRGPEASDPGAGGLSLEQANRGARFRAHSDDKRLVAGCAGWFRSAPTRHSWCRLTPQFSGGALTYVPWHFISDRPLQLLVRRLAHVPQRRSVRINKRWRSHNTRKTRPVTQTNVVTKKIGRGRSSDVAPATAKPGSPRMNAKGVAKPQPPPWRLPHVKANTEIAAVRNAPTSNEIRKDIARCLTVPPNAAVQRRRADLGALALYPWPSAATAC